MFGRRIVFLIFVVGFRYFSALGEAMSFFSCTALGEAPAFFCSNTSCRPLRANLRLQPCSAVSYSQDSAHSHLGSRSPCALYPVDGYAHFGSNPAASSGSQVNTVYPVGH